MAKKITIKKKLLKMPVGIRILFLFTFLSVASNLLSIFKAPISGSTFSPYLFVSLSMAAIFIYSVWKRSYMGWKVYLGLSLAGLAFNLYKTIFIDFPTYSGNVRTSAAIVMSITYLVGCLLIYYIYSQKKYFNR